MNWNSLKTKLIDELNIENSSLTNIIMTNKLYNLVNLLDDYKEILKQEFVLNPKDIVILNKNHLISILKEFINGAISNSEIENWANIIELNEFIKYEWENNILNDIICEIANPDINWKLTIDRAESLLHLFKNIK